MANYGYADIGKLADFANNTIGGLTANDIMRFPRADVQPIKHGRWFHINNDSFIYCSECNNEAYWDTDYGQQLFDYCPYCGAKMIKDGEQSG